MRTAIANQDQERTWRTGRGSQVAAAIWATSDARENTTNVQ
jgi:hypothetical protein